MKQQYTFSRIFSFMPILLVAFLWFGGSSVLGQTTYSVCGADTYIVPAGVTCLEVQIWGAGGAGGSNNTSSDGSGGGGGGGYTFAVIAVNPGDVIDLYVGCGGTAVNGADGNAGESSWFVNSGSYSAGGGQGGESGGNSGSAGAGGLGGAGNTYSGGAGGAGRDNNTGYGGGGGSSAGTGSNGNNGTDGGGSGPGAGGAAPVGGGAGGAGDNPGATATSGAAPGGGGGGSGDAGGVGGNGGHGQIIVTPVTVTICSDICMDPTPPGSSIVGYISNVSVGGLSNPTGWNGYTDYTGTGCESLVAGGTYTFNIDVYKDGAGSSPLNTFIFIDWNGDGTFTGDESYSLGGYNVLNSTVNYSLDITVPCDAVQRNIVMRVSTNYAADPTGCSNSSTYGEIEDYCLTIVPETPPTAVASSTYLPCGTSATLDATGSSVSTGYWTLISGSGTISDPTSQTTTITGLLNGSTTLQWTATGNCSADTDQTTFVVSGLPDDPVFAGIDAYTCTDPFVLDGSDPAPFTGFWTVPSAPPTPTFSSITDPNASISGMVAGTYILQWNVTTATCGTITDQVQVTFGSLPAADAGTDQSGLCPTSTVLDATPLAGLTGTWSYVSGPAGSDFIDVNDPGTIVYGLTNGTYQFQWTLTGGGCVGSTSDIVQVTVNPCTTTVTHDAFGNQTFTGCSYTYTDDGGTGSNYSNNIANTFTTFCPDDPDAFATLTFNTASVYPYDYINVYDDSGPGAPIVASIFYDPSPGGGFVYEPPLGTTITSSTGCLYVQFQSTASNNYPGWSAEVGCSSTAGTQNQTFVTVNNCGGGGGITLCQSGQVTAESNMDTNPPDLGLANQGCLGSQEGASNTWVYMIAESDGWIAFELQPAGGQDFDYAIWGPYDGGYACPGMTLDDPINCSWAANGGSSCDATIGIGTFNTLGNAVLPTDLSEGGFCNPSSNEGWTYPLWANQGDVYVLLFQNYGFNNSSFDFFVNEPGTTNIPAGESYASLGCDPVTALPIQLISFTGETKAGTNYLYWTTASEHQNAYFIIEKSDDGMNWEELGTVLGSGNTNEVNDYSTFDREPYDEITYYRLLQVDYDGTKRRYKTIALATEVEVEGLFSNVYPNPTSGTFYFNYGGNDFNNEIVVNVTNAMGQIVYSKTVQSFNASQSIEIDASQFSEGLYNVEIVQGETKEIKRISVIR